MKTLNFTVRNLENKNILVSFPELENANVELHAGLHINSKNNWSKYVPHGNSKKESSFHISEMNMKSRKIEVSITEMINVDEKRYPNQIKYRIVVHGNFGLSGYVTTGDMRLSKESFKKLTEGKTAVRIGKNYKQYEL